MGLWLKNADGGIEKVSGTGPAGKGWTDGTYDSNTGVVTFTSDDGLEFVTDDLRGADGFNGDDGLDGNMWHVGSGNPDASIGAVGDFYLDGDAGWVWTKRNSGWSNLYVNLTGPPGDGGGDFLPLTGGTLTGDQQSLTLMNATPTGQPHIGFYHNGQRKGYIGNPNATVTFLSAESNTLALGGNGVQVETNLTVTNDLQVNGKITGPGGAVQGVIGVNKGLRQDAKYAGAIGVAGRALTLRPGRRFRISGTVNVFLGTTAEGYAPGFVTVSLRIDNYTMTQQSIYLKNGDYARLDWPRPGWRFGW